MVININPEKPYDVYIGRPSKWGNPFSHEGDNLAQFKVATRREAVEQYEIWIRNNPVLMDELWELEDKVLGCWCKPKSCHGDILIKLLQEKKLEAIFKL
jgi:hypothetical protein